MARGFSRSLPLTVLSGGIPVCVQRRAATLLKSGGTDIARWIQQPRNLKSRAVCSRIALEGCGRGSANQSVSYRSVGGPRFGGKCSSCGWPSNNLISVNKLCKYKLSASENVAFKPLQNNRCMSESRPHNSDEKWESLLDNDEKKQNIASIPTRRENIFTVPNLLSFSRIVATPFIASFILNGQYMHASYLLLAAGITDVLDGQIARTWPSQKSAFGTALDPLGDKILVTVLTLTLAKASMLPMTLAVLIVGRDAALIAAVFYLRYRTCPPPRTVKRFFDPSLVNAQLNPTTVSKINTVLQLAVIWASLVAPLFEASESPLLYGLYVITGGTTLWSGLGYIFDKSTVQILRDK